MFYYEKEKKVSKEDINKVITYCPKSGKAFWKERGKKEFNTRYANKEAGYFNSSGYRIVTVNGLKFKLHRLIWFLTHGVWPEQIDHINGIRDDNRIINLREVNNAENGRNKKLDKYNKTGFNGVTWRANRNKWRVRITVNNKEISLGHFENFVDAVKARKEAEIKYGFHPNHGRMF